MIILNNLDNELFKEESLQINIKLTEITLLIFLRSRIEKLPAWVGTEPTTLDLDYQSGAFDHKAKATPVQNFVVQG